MTPIYTSTVTKELVIHYVQDNIEFKKQSLYLQVIIDMGRRNKIWQEALMLFFESPMLQSHTRFFSQN